MSDSDDSGPLVPPWGPVELEPNRPVGRRIGPRDIWFLLREGEIRLADRPAEKGAAREPPGAPDDPSVWSRWALPAPAGTGAGDLSSARVVLRPAVPDRPLIVQPEVPFALLPGAEARVFVRIPLLIRVETEGPTGEAILLRTIPTLELSDTWWGGFVEGDLCYWLPTTARREATRSLLEPHLVICPLRMVNESGTDLKVEKLSFRVEHLSLFADAPGFWADESRVRYQGEAEGSQIDMSGRPPDEAPGAALVSAPPVPVRGLRALTFNRLRHFPGFGWSA
jgi:hypothetical protein